MITFYPGPSKLYPEVKGFMIQAFEEGILSVNHRSKAFHNLAFETIANLKLKLNIPESYSVFFVSSATECWEIISQSLVSSKSFHVYNGAFGQKWFQTALNYHDAAAFEFGIDEDLSEDSIKVDAGSDLICFTSNETSNGTKVDVNYIKNVKKTFPDKLIAVDATSSMAGAEIEFTAADVWFASVQKCFGLPAGLAVLICSPAALHQAEKSGNKKYYNNLLSIKINMDKGETTHTPNVLGIYLLNKIMGCRDTIEKVDARLRLRSSSLYEFFKRISDFDLLVKNPSVRSDTVICIKGDEVKVSKIKLEAEAHGIILGNGYGDLKNTSFRVANFPAITNEDFDHLMKFFMGR